MLEKSFSLVHLLILLFVFLILAAIVLLFCLRVATWLNKTFPRRPGQRISIAGVLMGGIAYVFASGVVGALPAIIYIETKGAPAFYSSIQSGGRLYWLEFSIGLGCSALGGYFAAWIAKHDELLNGLLSSLLYTAIALYSILLDKGSQSLLTQILLLPVAPAFALAGGYLRQVQKSISRTPGITGASAH